jgi:hypothetical protein
MRINRRSFLTTLGSTAGAAYLADLGSRPETAGPLAVYDELERRLRRQADERPTTLTRAGVELVPSHGAFVPALDQPDATTARGARQQRITPDGLLTFAIDVPATSWVAGELLLEAGPDLRPGLRAYVLCDTTLVGAPMVAAAEWGVTEITDAAPRVSGARPDARVPLAPWLARKGRRYVTVAGPHFRDGGTLASLRLRVLDRPVEEPLYRFAFITDTHVRLTGREDWMNRKMGEASAPELRRTLTALAAEEVAFVVHGGDMTEAATREEFLLLRDVLKSQPLPVYGCIGNHDRYLPTSRPDARELLAALFPGGELDYSFTKPPLRFVVLDVEIEREDVRARKLQWLHDTLRADSVTPTVFVWHYPPFNRGGPSTCGFRMHDWSQLGREVLMEALAASPNLVACINGHDHWDEVNRHHGLTFVQNAAFVEWPNTYRLFRVYHDRLEWEVRQAGNRGYVRESFLPDKAVSWMIATGTGDLSGSVRFGQQPR